MLIKNDKPMAAISYDTQTYSQLRQFIDTEEGQEIVRIDPNDFLQNPTDNYQYINLVIKDFDQRKQVSALLDQLGLDRFTYVDRSHQSILGVRPGEKFKIGLGCFLYPAVFGYSGSIGKDVIVHSLTALAENVTVGDGCFISGSVTAAGSCKIGNWCFIGNNVFLIDNVELVDNVRLLPGMGIRKSIKTPGTYYNPNIFKIEKIII
jgi:acetyltransferase-like isoleucine patch superfamily enzyme